MFLANSINSNISLVLPEFDKRIRTLNFKNLGIIEFENLKNETKNILTHYVNFFIIFLFFFFF